MAMARARSNNSKQLNSPPLMLHHLLCFSPFSSLLLLSPKKSQKPFLQSTPLSLLALFTLCFILVLTTLIFNLTHCSVFSPVFSPVSPSSSSHLFLHASLSTIFPENYDPGQPRLTRPEMAPLPARGSAPNLTKEEREFWKQPDNEGYVPCLDFGIEYRRMSPEIVKEKRRFLVVVVSGGLNQQRNQIVDAVVFARVLRAALVLPILQVNLIWGDESEFSDIFDVQHFKKTLQADVRIVSSLPSTHLVSRQAIETQIPFDISPHWIRTRFSKQLNEEGLLVLKGLDSKLSKNLPPDLQKLKCKVAFHALRFAAPIRELGNRLARRMWIEGPYIAVHLRLEKDVWVRTGCRTGLGPTYDRMVHKERATRSEYLTGRVNMSHSERRLAGLCPLNAHEVARLLKALGAPRGARVYLAGGEPYGGSRALEPLVDEFPNWVTKEMLARNGELVPYANRSSALAAIDYIVALSSDVFLPSHGGNMGRAMQGHRAYSGHRKYIKPNKRMMLPFFEDPAISESEFGTIMRKLHEKSQGQPEPRAGKRDRDVIAYPVPECMCKRPSVVF